MSLKSYLSVLKNVDFTKLWVSQATSQLTNYILSFAILIKVFTLTNSSLSVAVIIMAFGIATVFFGSLGGIAADRFDRRWLLTIVNFLQAGSIALYFVVGGSFWSLVLITFLYSSLNQFYIPVEAPTIPSLVAKSQILIANSYFAFTNSAALIIGFAAAGPISGKFGQSAPFAIGVILLCIAGLACLSLPSLKSRVRREQAMASDKLWADFKEGVAHFWQNKTLHYPLLSLIAIQIANGMIITIAPAFMKEAIGIDLDTGSILVVLPLGLGILIGSLVLGAEEKYFSKRELIFGGFIGMGLMLFGLSFIEHFHSGRYLYYAIFGLMIGFFNAHIFAPSHSLLQTNAPDHMRGRIYASLYLLLQLAATLPTVLIGLLADSLPITYIVTVIGVFLAVIGITVWSRNREVLSTP